MEGKGASAPLMARGEKVEVSVVGGDPVSKYVLFLVFIIACTTLSALSALQALVSHITTRYSETTYEIVVGLLMVSALPCALAQFKFDGGYDGAYGFRSAMLFRLCLSCVVLCVCDVALVWQETKILYPCAFVIGVGHPASAPLL